MADQSNEPSNLAELREQLRSASRDAVTLREMARLGYWDPAHGPGKIAEDWWSERDELGRELQQLLNQEKLYENRETMLRNIRERRMAESRERQKENKERRERERKERAERWRQTRQQDIIYLGEDVSNTLGDKQSDAGKIAALELPQLPIVTTLAQAMGISVGELKFLSFHREVSRVSHYRRFYMPKKTGGQRLISAPMPRLKSAQHWIFENILLKIPVHESAHGFVPERSIVSNAKPHTGQDLVINMDLKDFFPTITFSRVKGIFRAFGYSSQIATILALICTEPENEEVEVDGETFYMATSERHLPQGAPTSPALTNILCYRFDRRMIGMAERLNFAYTRYADDLSFSASGEATKEFRKLLWRANAIIKNEGFTMHPDKLRIMRRGERQEVTGLIVNDNVGIDRRMMRRFRALIYQLEKDGLDGKEWLRKRGKPMLAAMKGYADFINMVYPEKSARLQERVRTLLAIHDFKPEIRHPRRDKQQQPPELPKKKSWLGRLLSRLFGD